MASAAAVGADSARSPINNDIGEDAGAEGEVTSGIYRADEAPPDVNGNAADEDSDEDLPSNPLRGAKRAKPPNGDVEEEDEEAVGGDDLFGDEEDGGEKPVRELDDEELDSGDDLERDDRAPGEPEPEYIAQEKITMDLEYPRLPGPEPSDGEMYLLKVPSFLSVDPHAWHHTTFQPPTTDHHNFTRAPSATFSAYNTALSTIRWRHSPSNPTQLQSNARLLRWSDGSLTLQLSSDPSTQYELDGKAVAPPQRNPSKPTPTSTNTARGSGRQGTSAAAATADEKFDPRKDGFTYLLRPYDENGTMLVTHKVTTGLTVTRPQNVEDDAVAKLKASLAAGNRSQVDGLDRMHLVSTDEDPEKVREAALQAERQMERQLKRSEAARERESARANRAMGGGRSGGGRSGGGLNASMLEDEEDGGGGGGGRGRAAKRPQAGRRRRRNSEYSEDEDFGRKRFTKEDEYEEDGFMVDDEEEEAVASSDDPDDGIVEEERPRSSRKIRERTPKRARDDDEDAEGEEVEDDAPPVAARAAVKKRRVVSDDEDEE